MNSLIAAVLGALFGIVALGAVASAVGIGLELKRGRQDDTV